jgi:hypothetical protein
MKTTRFQYYLTLTHSVRGVYILCATLIARAALRLSIPNQVEGLILHWAMGVVNAEALR